MIAFENYLIDKGFKKVGNNTNEHVISTMVNLGYTYQLNNKKINIGLSEANKPVTILYPRPRIYIEKIENETLYILDQQRDDAMNIVLQKVSFNEIFEAMFDTKKSIKLKL